MENADTIFALASAQGRAGVSVIRVSGPAAFSTVEHLVGRVPAPRKTSLCVLRDDGEVLDQALVITFEKGASFTGEDVAEFHVHGGVALVRSVLNAIGKQPGLRAAKAGEFTRRALENDRLDLPQVEGLADLIEAETEAQRKQALKVMRGELSAKCNTWRLKLVRAMALLEASIDFADEDVPTDVTPEVLELGQEVLQALTDELEGSKAAERIRDGFEVALVGRPNIGKSTLLNAIAGRDVAITSEVAGTTRDVIEVRLELGGLAVTLLDLAGIRDSEDRVERLGVDRAKDRAENADVRIFLVEDRREAESLGISIQKDDIITLGKGDQNTGTGLSVSGKTGVGIEKLLDILSERMSEKVSGSSSLIRRRHAEAIELASKNLSMVIEMMADPESYSELIAAELRFSIGALDELIGRVDVEQVLGEIFAGFCIGK